MEPKNVHSAGKALVTNINYEVPSWSQIYDLLICLAQKIQKEPYKPDIVVGIARGGIVPARILTDLLGTPQLTMITVEFYIDIAKPSHQPTLQQSLPISAVGKKLLLVDDIADTGQSLRFAKTYLEQQGASTIKTATLYKKPHSITVPDFYEKETVNWVAFPWDIKETLRELVEKQPDERILNQKIAKLVKGGLPQKLAKKLLSDLE